MNLSSTNILNLSIGGTFAASGEISSTPADVDALFREIRARRMTHLIVYVHGGRVSEYEGRVQASRLVDTFREIPHAHPLFVLWESSEREIIVHELNRIAADPLFERLVRPLTLFLVSKLRVSPNLSRGLTLPLVSVQEASERREREQQGQPAFNEAERANLTPLTAAEEQQLERLLRGDAGLRRSAEEIAARLSSPGRGPAPAQQTEPAGPLTGAVIEHLRNTSPSESRSILAVTTALIRPAIQVTRRSIIRIKSRLDHGVYCTLVEELLREFYLDKLGSFFWDSMKRKVHAAFSRNDGQVGIDLHGGTYLLEQLAAYIEEPGTPPLSVSLVGHSAGTIFLCALLDRAREILPPSFKFDQIVFMAPAVDFELCRRAVVDHPDRFNRFVLITLDDAAEICDAIAGPVYPRSLLYFVSGLLEGETPVPLVGLGRYLAATPPYEDRAIQAVRRFLEHSPAAQLVWATEAQNEQATGTFSCHARRHGDFSSDSATLASLLSLLSGMP